jgi:hypothetical protein
MTATAVAKDCWILGQLAGIRMLEEELTAKLKASGGHVGEELHERVVELNAWLNRVERVLTTRAINDPPRRVAAISEQRRPSSHRTGTPLHAA